MIDRARIESAVKSPKTKKVGLWLLAAVLLFTLLGFFALPPIVKSVLVDRASLALHRPVTVQAVRINPYAMTLALEGVSVGEREGEGVFAAFDTLFVDVNGKSLFHFAPVVSEIRLENPRVNLVRLDENRYNFSDLIEEWSTPKSPEEAKKAPPSFSINNIQLRGGRIDFDDRALDEKHALEDITLTLPFVSNMAHAVDSFVEPHFSARLDGAPLVAKGRSKPFSQTRESEFSLEVDGLPLPQYFDYSPVKLPVKLVSGALDSHLKLSFVQNEAQAPSLMLSGSATIDGVKLVEAGGAPLLAFKRLDVAFGETDLLAGKFLIERLAVDSPEVHVKVDREGALNWMALSPRPAAAKPAAEEKKSGSPSWALGELKLSSGTVHWQDESRSKPFSASVEAIDLTLKKLSSEAQTPAEFDLDWRVAAGDWLKIERFAVRGGQLDLAKREATIAGMEAHGVRSLVRRTADGTIEWIEPPAMRTVEASQNEVSTPWKVRIEKYAGEDIAVRFEDHGVSPAVTQNVEGLEFTAGNLSTEPGETATLSTRFKLNRKGTVAIDGTISPQPLAAKLKLDLESLELLPVQPYVEDRLNVAITKGLLTVKGDLEIKDEGAAKGGEMALAGGFTGQATIGDFQAVDKLNSADFLHWKSLYAGKVEARLQPDSVNIGEIALSDFFARVIVSAEGRLNLMQIVRRNEKDKTPVPVADAAPPVEKGDGKASVPVAEEPRKALPLPLKIGKITVQGGNVRFTDNFVKPNYTANLQEIGGSITGLSSEPGSLANVDLRGSYDRVAPLTVQAKVNPLSAKPYLDLQAEIKGVELTTLSSYAGKYAGYAIDKGKLSLFVKYKIEEGKLAAENRVFLDQLSFGDRVESPDATTLPVTLAVSLLKNRRGEIDLNLPISGSLDDPQFSIGGLVWQVIGNLIVKAVTSPFALIGSMFGDGEEMSNVEFEHGKAQLTAETEKRLENLAKALADRPGLRLDIEGVVDAERDREGLKSASLELKVKAAKREEMTGGGQESGAAETLSVSSDEYPVLLERVYKAEKFPKPRNMIGFVKSLPVEEMEKLILANTTVDEDDLRDLGERRAKAVRDWLIARQIESERLFLLPVRVHAAGEGEKKDKSDAPAKSSRVDFSLK